MIRIYSMYNLENSLNNRGQHSNFNYVSIIFYLNIAYATISRTFAQILIQNIRSLISKPMKNQINKQYSK